jgi:hypothetical protein
MKMNSLNQGKIFKWSYEQVMDLRSPEPYDEYSISSLCELDAPDGSTTFLVIRDKRDEDSGLVKKYAIEAPADCPMRQAFEWGDFTWDEYWTHKDYLYELSVPFNPGPVSSRIISPSDMSQFIKDLLANLGERFPYELKRRHLEIRVDYSLNYPAEYEIAKHEYDSFIAKYAHRFAKRAA